MRLVVRGISTAIALAGLLGCDLPRAYPRDPGTPSKPRAVRVGVKRAPVRWVPHVEHTRVSVTKLRSFDEGRLPDGTPFPILLERIAPDGSVESFSTEHRFDYYDPPSELFAAGDDGVWFQPQAGTFQASFDSTSPVFGGSQLAVSEDGTAWLSNGNTLAHIASDGTTSFYAAPGKMISRIVGGRGSSILALDRDRLNIYRIDGARAARLLGGFLDVSPGELAAHEGRDAMWFADETAISQISADGCELRTLSVHLPRYSTVLGADGKALWALTQIPNSGGGAPRAAIIDRYAVDGTISRFRIAYSLIFSSCVDQSGQLLIDAAIPGSVSSRSFLEINAEGKGTQTILSRPGWTRTGIVSRPDGTLVFGWDRRSIAMLDRRNSVDVSMIPRP